MLVASTDPAPSLADALGVPLSSSPRTIAGAPGRVAAVEIDAPAALRRWLRGRRQALEQIVVQGTWLEQQDVSTLLQLSLPGVDELAALLEISRLSQVRRFDLVVVDTAPTGHTLRMMSMPETFAGLADLFGLMREKRRVMEEALRGSARVGAEDALIDEMANLAQSLSALLRDPVRTQVSWVTIPEPLAMEESADAIGSLEKAGIEVSALIVNRLTPPPPSPCGYCEARRAFEAHARRMSPEVGSVTTIAERDVEPRSIRALLAIDGELRAQRGPSTPRAPRRRAEAARRWAAKLDGGRVRPENLVRAGTRLVMFGGKGGVGKTTCAAAVALAAATRTRSRRVLLVSTDPAHSLGDVLGQAIGDSAQTLSGGPANLEVREIDPAAVLARIRARYLAAVDRMFAHLGGRAFDAAYDRAVMRSLIQLAPPGLDELAAALEITDAITTEPPAWDLVVMDTAPTGHALRLLEMPALLQGWTKALMAILLEYQGIARLGELGETLLQLSRGIRRLRELLADEQRSMFVLVTRAAALPRLESARLMERVDALQVHVPALVVNAVGRGTCARCRRAAALEKRELQRIQGLAGRAVAGSVITAGAEVPPPVGVRALGRWSRTEWRHLPVEI